MSWRDVLDGVDAVESWIAGQSYWVQVLVLLAVLLPIGWAAAGLIDRIVERILWPYTRREIRRAAVAAIAHQDGLQQDRRRDSGSAQMQSAVPPGPAS